MPRSPAHAPGAHPMAPRRRVAGLLAWLLSLLLVAVASAAVAVLVVRVPLGEVDSAEPVEAVEAVIVVPPAPPSLPTRVPGTAGEPSAVKVQPEASNVTPPVTSRVCKSVVPVK